MQQYGNAAMWQYGNAAMWQCASADWISYSNRLLLGGRVKFHSEQADYNWTKLSIISKNNV
jgi:hypothetical protein